MLQILPFVIVSIFFISGCVNKPIPKLTNPFNEQDFIPYSKVGTASITGQVFLKTRGGDVKYGAGDTIFMFPSTPYTREMQHFVNHEITNRVNIENVDKRWRNYIKKTTADGSGNFEFSKIPAGEYYLECSLFWEVPASCLGCNGLEETGDVLRKQIKISEGEKLKIILTD
jgi:hypothetical protein